MLEIISQQDVLGQAFKVYGTWENPLFLAKDVAEWIEHSDVSMMVKNIDDDEKLTQALFVSGQNREMWFLTEDGLYEVLMQSRKPIAKAFKKEVKRILKEVRTTGGYLSNNLTQEHILQITKRLGEIERKLTEQPKPLRIGKSEWRETVNCTIRWISYGTDEAPQNLFTQAYDMLEERLGVCLRTRLKNKKNRMEEFGTSKSRINQINRLDVIDDDSKLVEAFLEVMSDMVDHYGLEKDDERW